jgi:hypothetical protein
MQDIQRREQSWQRDQQRGHCRSELSAEGHIVRLHTRNEGEGERTRYDVTNVLKTPKKSCVDAMSLGFSQ